MKKITKYFMAFALFWVASVASAQNEWAELSVQCSALEWLSSNNATFAVKTPDANGVYRVYCRGEEQAGEPILQWDSQFYISFGEANKLKEGDVIRVTMSVKADAETTVVTQYHTAPQSYLHWSGIGNVNFTTGWSSFDSGELTIGTVEAGAYTIAFNLATGEENNFYFRNIQVEVFRASQSDPITTWVDIITNGDLSGSNMSCFFSKEYPSYQVVHPTVSNGTIVVNSAASESDWDSQFYIRLPQRLPDGTPFKVRFDYKATVATSVDTQCQSEPGNYLTWSCIGAVSFSTVWKSFEIEATVPSACSGNFQTIAFNLTKTEDIIYYFKNIQVEIPEEYVEKYQVTANSANNSFGTVSLSPISSDNIYVIGTEVAILAEANEGYHFTKWSNNSTNNPYVLTVTEDMSLTALFSPNQYTMTFVLDNGEESVVVTQDFGTELTAPQAPQKTGFTFIGWNPVVPATIPAENKTFTAQWERNSYTLKFVVDGVETTTEVAYEAPITAPENPEKEGYTFTGWNPEIPETMPASNVTYTAQFTVNQYTMTFVLDNGEESVVVTQDFGTELTAPEDPQKTGFTFAGWIPEVPATIPAENKTFTAQWEPIPIVYYQVSAIPVNENYGSVLLSPESDNGYAAGAEVTITAEANEGYHFTKWSDETTDNPYVLTVNDEVSLMAIFSPNQYTMRFVLNNGEDDVVVTQDYGTALTAPVQPVRDGFSFTGWNPDVPATVPAENIIFTAQWEPIGNVDVVATDVSQISNVIYLEEVNALVGCEKVLSFQMKNTAAISAFQFDLVLPEGVTPATYANGRIKCSLANGRRVEGDDHSFTVNMQDDGSYRFLSTSNSNQTFTGSEGEIATLTVEIADDMATGIYPITLKNMKLNEAVMSNFYETAEVVVKLTVDNYVLGDVSGDGIVDVSDCVGIANHILGNTPAGFNIKAADVNMDNKIDVTDCVGVANIILYGAPEGQNATSARITRMEQHGNRDPE